MGKPIALTYIFRHSDLTLWLYRGVGFIIIDELTTKFDTDMILFSFFIAVFRKMGWLTLGALHGDSPYSYSNSPTPPSAASSLRMGFPDRQLPACAVNQQQRLACAASDMVQFTNACSSLAVEPNSIESRSTIMRSPYFKTPDESDGW